MNDIVQSLLLGVVEGITEFLPVSSTGHMRLVEALVTPDAASAFGSKDFSDSFDVFIQIGAIIAVVVFFRRKILYLLGLAHSEEATAVPTDPAPDTLVAAGSGDLQYSRGQAAPSDRMRTLVLLVVATLPLAIGYLGAKKTEKYMIAHPGAEPKWIAVALGVGGVVMFLVEVLKPKPKTSSMSQMTYGQAIVVGLCQILAAVFPGTSRSAATILPALGMGVSRPAAAEFSFFLAIPAMFAAAGVKVIHFLRSPNHGTHEVLLLAIGTIVSFIVAYGVVAVFMSFIRKYTFVPFAIYRVIIAIAVFALATRAVQG